MSTTEHVQSPIGPAPVGEPIRERPLLVRWALGREGALTAVAFVLFTFFSVFGAHFFSLGNVYDMMRVGTFMLIVGVPLTYLFIAREIDISVGALYGLSTVMIAVMIVTWGIDPWLAAPLTILFAAGVGAINGFACTVVGVPSFIFTLGMYSLLRGVSYIVTGGQPIDYPLDLQSSFFDVAAGTIGGFPVQMLWGLVVFAVGAFILHFTRFGAHVYATGGNDIAARASGISTRRVRFISFVATSASCGLCGALTGVWLLQGSPSTGSGFELQVFAAVIIGGVALAGGSGTIYGTFLGVVIIGMLANGLVLINAQANWNEFFMGLIIVAVASLEIAINRRDSILMSLRRGRWHPSRS